MSGSIHLGYEVGTGKPVAIPLRHTAVTGQTQESGKTTTLEGLITRSKLRGLAYITKRGESSFHVKKSIPPYFRERTDWQFVAAILEATMSERLKFQRSWIMKLCEARHAKNENWAAPRTLADVMHNTDSALEKARGMNESVYYELREYLRLVVPQIDRLPYSTQLEMVPGVNVMDLTAYEFPMQALVVRSCIEWIRAHERDTINVIPEAWKFAPKQRNSPVRLAAEEYIREGAALRNFLWLDSQDIAGVADVLLRQIGVWIFGVQRAKHEIERTLDHIPEGLLARRPRAGDVATLGKGQFFVCFGREMYKVYVQPAWMKAAHADAIARGEEPVESAKAVLEDYEQDHPEPAPRESHGDQELSRVNKGEHPDADCETDSSGVQGDAREKDAGAGAQGEEVRVLHVQQPAGAGAAHGGGSHRPPDRGAQRGHDPAGGSLCTPDGVFIGWTEEEIANLGGGAMTEVTPTDRLKLLGKFENPHVQWLLEQYTTVVAAHDALAERVRALEQPCKWCAEGNTPIASSLDNGKWVHHSSVGRVLCTNPKVLPSSAAKAEEAEKPGAESSGPAPGNDERAAVATQSREARSNPGAEFKPAALSPAMLLTHISPRMMEGIYAYIRERAKNEEDLVILHLLTTQPELRVKVTRQTIEADGSTLRGQLAILISEKFFDKPRSFVDVRNECLRRNFIDKKMSNATLSAQLAKLGEFGFLTSEPTGYQSVPGMRIFIEDASSARAAST